MKNEKIETKNQNGEPTNGEIALEQAAALKCGVKNEEFETEYDTLDPISAARNGKIAALSRDIRESLNRRIRRGQPGPDILEWLNAEPSVVDVLGRRFESKPITRQNLWEWRHGGYKQWARHRAACLRLNHRRKGKRIDRHQLGDEMSQLYAEELTVTLDELIDFAPDSEVRMQRLEQGLNQIRGWRRNDYHAQRMVLQTERMALDKEKLQRRSQCQTQELALKEKRLALDHDRFLRSHVEYIVNTCNNPQVGAAARAAGVSYAQKVKAVDKLMFGDPCLEQASTVKPNGSPESGVQSQSKAEGEIQNAESGKGEEEKGGGGANVQHSTAADPQPLTNNSQPTGSSEKGDKSVPQAGDGKTLQNGQNDAVLDPAPSHPVVPGRTQNETENKCSPESKVQSPESGKKMGMGENIQHSTEGASTDPDKKNHEEPQLKPARASMSPAVALKFVENLRAKVKSMGYPAPPFWDVAALTAYLSGQPAKWYSTKICDLETMQPPAIDPRLDPNSPWCKAWPHIQAMGLEKN